jgi:hypothetical protein
MRANIFSFAAILAMASGLPLHAAEKPHPAQTSQAQPRKVWTNDDMDALRARGLISTFTPEVSEAVAQSAPVSTAPAAQQSASPVYSSRLEDPAWYAQQAAGLQAELDRRQALLRGQQAALALAERGITQPGIALDQPSFGVTPQDAADNLEAQAREVQSRLDDLSDLARINDIPPGVVRG